MSRRCDPRRDALLARIETAEAKAGKALSALKAKLTRYTGLADALKRLRRDLRAHDDARAGGQRPDSSPETGDTP